MVLFYRFQSWSLSLVADLRLIDHLFLPGSSTCFERLWTHSLTWLDRLRGLLRDVRASLWSLLTQPECIDVSVCSLVRKPDLLVLFIKFSWIHVGKQHVFIILILIIIGSGILVLANVIWLTRMSNRLILVINNLLMLVLIIDVRLETFFVVLVALDNHHAIMN